jgi:hypothetical protein
VSAYGIAFVIVANMVHDEVQHGGPNRGRAFDMAVLELLDGQRRELPGAATDRYADRFFWGTVIAH